jgi:nicotinamide mononucleotide transporter
MSTQVYIEVLGALLGVLYILLGIKAKPLMWPVGLLSSAIYLYVFFVVKLYAESSLQLYYIGVSIWGWYLWARNQNKNGTDQVEVLKITIKTAWFSFVAFLVLFGFLTFVLQHLTDSPLPKIDAFITALSLVATWMLAKRYIEQWWIWIIVDALSAALYINRGLYPTAILFLIYTIMAVFGYVSWKKMMLPKL